MWNYEPTVTDRREVISRTSCDVELFNYKLPTNNSKFVIPSFFSSEHSDD